jgi:hypothetical protein
MKKLAILLFSLSAVFADEPSRSLWDYHPLHIGGNMLRIGGASVDPKKGDEGGHLYYRKSNAFLFMLLPVSAETYFFPRVEWNTVTLDWNENPKFRETHFYYLQFGLTLYSTAIEKWRWIARVDFNIDLEHFSQPGPYGLTTGLLWGAYQIHRKWHYHIGATGYKGMEGQMVYPLIGVDYSPDKKWTFQAIFPINYAIKYRAAKWCLLSLQGRPLRERLRVGNREPEPRAIFNYSTIGAEFNVHLEKKDRFEVEFFGGYNFGGSFYIKSQGGHRAYYTHLKGAPYGGANLDYAF